MNIEREAKAQWRLKKTNDKRQREEQLKLLRGTRLRTTSGTSINTINDPPEPSPDPNPGPEEQLFFRSSQ